jgi:HlyD family secretion protein
MKIIKYILAILILLGIVAAVIWYKKTSSPKNEQYQTETVRIGDITQTVSASGTLNPVVLVSVGTQVSGTVEKLYADFNDRVTANQILLELDPTLLKATLQQSSANVKKAEANLELAKANEKRALPLMKKGFISTQDWEQLVQVRKAASADLDLALAQVARDKTNLNYATIRSPVSGVVVNRSVDVGQTVAASFQTPVLFSIAQDLSKMQIDSSFAEADIGNILPNQTVKFTVDAFPNQSFKGIVKQIRLNPTTQQNVVTYDVVVIVDNPEEILLPGMTAYVNIVTAEHKQVLLVPNAALRFRPKNGKMGAAEKPTLGIGKVYKINSDGSLEPISGKLGITDNRYTEFLGDKLKNGDTVVVNYATENASGSSSTFRLRMF